MPPRHGLRARNLGLRVGGYACDFLVARRNKCPFGKLSFFSLSQWGVNLRLIQLTCE